MKASNSYRSMVKGTALFGSVQVFQILINLVRGKFVALLLGPEGMGVASLFNTSSNTIQKFSSLGLNMAIVKETASSEDDGSLPGLLAVARRLLSLTSLLGAAVCVIFAPFLSRITFGKPDWTWQFMLLGAAVGLTVAANGKLSILQGLHKVKVISKASLYAAGVGLLTGVPLYWAFGQQGIVPAMALLALSMWAFYSYWMNREITSPREKFSLKNHKNTIRRLLFLGILLMANDLILSLVQYLINLYIQWTGSTADVGLYQAANSVTNQYAGVVFSAMAMDYFPRLSKAAADNDEMRGVVNRQTEIVSLFIAPAVAMLILTAPLLIRMLLSSEFLPILPLMRWMGLGILLRALAVPMGYISFAKGNRKLFFWLEGVFCNLLTLSLSVGCFRWFGLMGLGYALVADNALCLVVYYFVNRRMYGYRIFKPTLCQGAVAVTAGITVFVASMIGNAVFGYMLMGFVACASLVYSFVSLKRKLHEG